MSTIVARGLNNVSLPSTAGGGGAVASVNGKTGVVVLVPSDIGAAASTLTLTAGTGLSGGGDLSANRTFTVSYGTTAGTATQGNDTRVVNAVQTSRTLTAGTGLTGGGDLSADRTFTVSYGTTAGTATQGNDTRVVNAVQTTRTLTAGTGLTGGGDLSADRTFTVAYGTTAGTATQGNDTRVVNAVQTTDYGAFADVSSLGTNVSQGTPHFQQRTEPGSVTRLQGQIALASATFAANTTLATLNGSFPASTMVFLTRTQGSNTQTLLKIASDGTIKNVSAITSAGADTINFDGMTFIHA